jgi:hypothetical protein
MLIYVLDAERLVFWLEIIIEDMLDIVRSFFGIMS